MADPNTLRILSIDGGGMRAAFSVQWMNLFVQLWGINTNEIWKYFDVICGTSAGALQALGYANGITPEEMNTFLDEAGPWIFSTSSLFPNVRATLLDKLATMILGGSFYPNTNLIGELDTFFGPLTMQDLKTNTLITSYNYGTDTPTLFSNVTFPGSSGSHELLKNVGLASASAPFYFLPASFGGMPYLDGAMIKNNPAMLGYMLGNIVKPTAKRTCILSIGSGLGKIGFQQPPVMPPPPDESNMSFVFSLLGILIAGNQETDAKLLTNIDQYTLQNTYTYRANAQLDPDVDTELDNASSEMMEYMRTLATSTFMADAFNISNFIAHMVI